jgi:hypothetical protein
VGGEGSSSLPGQTLERVEVIGLSEGDVNRVQGVSRYLPSEQWSPLRWGWHGKVLVVKLPEVEVTQPGWRIRLDMA